MLKLAAVFFIFSLLVGGARADAIASTDVAGTQFRVRLISGRLLDSSALVGAVLNLALPGGTTGHVRIAQVEKDPQDPDEDVFLHRLLVAESPTSWVELCSPVSGVSACETEGAG